MTISKGHEKALTAVRDLSMQSVLKKVEYKQALHTYQTYLSEVQSEQRDRAKDMFKRREGTQKG
jgi:hypothetical protein